MNELIRFLFKGEPGRTFTIRRTKLTRGSAESAQPPPAEDVRFKLVKVLSWILAAVLLICIIGVFSLLLLEKQIPDFIPPIITAIIGYFGGAISAFFGLKQ
jgi:hypothetical protein